MYVHRIVWVYVYASLCTDLPGCVCWLALAAQYTTPFITAQATVVCLGLADLGWVLPERLCFMSHILLLGPVGQPRHVLL